MVGVYSELCGALPAFFFLSKFVENLKLKNKTNTMSILINVPAILCHSDVSVAWCIKANLGDKCTNISNNVGCFSTAKSKMGKFDDEDIRKLKSGI